MSDTTDDLDWDIDQTFLDRLNERKPMAKKKSIFHVDEDRLDQENARNPSLVRKYSRMKADITHDRDKVKRKLELYEAKLKLRMRLRPGKYGLPDKPPMELIKAAILADEVYQKKQERLAKLEYELDLAESAVKSLEDKSKRLRDIKELLQINYRTEHGYEASVDSHSHRDSEQRAARRGMKRSKER